MILLSHNASPKQVKLLTFGSMKVRHQISSDNSSKSQPYLNTTVYFFSQTSHTQRNTTIHVQ